MPPLKAIWEASDRLCSKRLQPFLPEMIRVLRRHAELPIDAVQEARPGAMSASTIDRLLRPYRKRGGRKWLNTTRAAGLLKGLIPVRTFADWDRESPVLSKWNWWHTAGKAPRAST